MKIAIIGMPGAGKSSLGMKLQKLLQLPLYHLDQYYWQPGWQRPDPDAFKLVHDQLCAKDAWIIEGCAMRLLNYRIACADIIIFLDFPSHTCLYRVCKRSFLNFGTTRIESPQGCPEGIPSLEFLRYILDFNIEKKPLILQCIQEYGIGKKLFTIKNNDELRRLLSLFESQSI